MDKTSSSYWYQDFLQAKLDEIRPILALKTTVNLASQSKLNRQEVLHIIEAIFKHCEGAVDYFALFLSMKKISIGYFLPPFCA